MTTYWNAEVYDRIGTPMRRWAQAVIDDLNLNGDETVLDAGCGAGAVTFDLLERLPRGKIYAVDSSPEMIGRLSQSIQERGVTNVIPIQADLTEFTLPEPVDVVSPTPSCTGFRTTTTSFAVCLEPRSRAAACAPSAAVDTSTRD